MDEFAHVAGLSRFTGYELQMLTPDDVERLHPLARTEGLLGGIYEPDDGHVDPTLATNAMAQVARKNGAKILRYNPVTSIRREGDLWVVETEKTTIHARHLVNAAGTWGWEIGHMMGLNIPSVPVLHQYLVTDTVGAVADRIKQGLPELPMIRDPEESWYVRQERDGLILGPYEKDAQPWSIDGCPPEFGAELMPPDLDRVEDIIMMAMERIPALETGGVKSVVNGPITFTPDANPLIGPAHGLPNAWLLTGSSMGVMEGGGSGWFLAHWMTHGAPPNQSGKWFNAVQYGVRQEDHLIDMDEVETLAKQHKPQLIIAGGSAYPRVIDFKAFREIADSVGAYLMVDMAHFAGLVAGGAHPSPLPYADVVTTTTHKTLRGPRGGLILAKANPEIEKKLNAAVFPGAQGGPLMHVIAAKAVCFKEALEPGFKDYQAQVIRNAQAMAEVFVGRGFEVVSGGTDNHLFLLSLIKQGLTGKAADAALGAAHITVNKNAVPNDPQSPFVTSGLRIGTPAVTTRGFKEGECRELAGWICDILADLDNPSVIERVRGQVAGLCASFPVYAE